MYSIYSFDPELIKLHTLNGSQNYYKRKYIVAESEKEVRFLLQIKKIKWMLRLIKLSELLRS